MRRRNVARLKEIEMTTDIIPVQETLFVPKEQFWTAVSELMAASDAYDPKNRIIEILSELGVMPEDYKPGAMLAEAVKKHVDSK
jgi:hypothetical protein